MLLAVSCSRSRLVGVAARNAKNVMVKWVCLSAPPGLDAHWALICGLHFTPPTSLVRTRLDALGAYDI